MEAKEVNITYETLFELLKREKDTADIQKLEPSFFDNFVEYLNEKKDMLNRDDTLFSYDEKKKVEKQIDNARRLIKEIYERREKKILNIGLIKSRTKSHVIDTSSLLDNEKVLNAYRESVIYNVMDGKPVLQVKHQEKEAKEEINAASNAANDVNDSKEEAKSTRLVRFLY